MINQVILIGNLGQDPELKYTKTGTAVANVSVATNRSWKDKDDNWQDETEWHRVIVWAQAAEFCNNYLKKGNKVYVEGRLQTRKWQDQNGNDRYTTEVVAKEIKSLTAPIEPPSSVVKPVKKEGEKKVVTPPLPTD